MTLAFNALQRLPQRPRPLQMPNNLQPDQRQRIDAAPEQAFFDVPGVTFRQLISQAYQRAPVVVAEQRREQITDVTPAVVVELTAKGFHRAAMLMPDIGRRLVYDFVIGFQGFIKEINILAYA